MSNGFTWHHATTLFTQSILSTLCHMDMAPGVQAHGHSLGGAYILFPLPAASCSMAKTTQIWFRLNESLREKQRPIPLPDNMNPPTFWLLFVLMTVCNDSELSHSKDYFVFSLKMKRHCVNKRAEMAHVGREGWPQDTSTQSGGWMNVQEQEGTAIPWQKREPSGSRCGAKQQSPSRPLNGKTWSNHQFPSLLDLKPSTFTGVWRRGEKTFSKDPSYVGCGAEELSVSNTREPLHAKHTG